MPKLNVKCPAKINLTLEIVNKRADGFHNIKSIMQTIDLYDTLTIEITDSTEMEIELSGNNSEIPYNEKNLVYKAVKLFAESINLKNKKISIYIEKNIPVSAGLAGGSTDAAGTFYGLNKLFDNILSEESLNSLCAKLGSDLNFCLKGGCKLATSRGEILKDLPYQKMEITLIKPKNLGISAKEAYTKYANLKDKRDRKATERMLELIKSDKPDGLNQLLYNDLERAVFDDYAELQKIKKAYPESIMSGSGSTYFAIGNLKEINIGEDFWFKNSIKTTENGVY